MKTGSTTTLELVPFDVPLNEMNLDEHFPHMKRPARTAREILDNALKELIDGYEEVTGEKVNELRVNFNIETRNQPRYTMLINLETIS